MSRPRRPGSIVSGIQLFAVSARAWRLEVDAQDEVDLAAPVRLYSPGCVYAAKVGGVKVQRIESEIGVIERVEEVDFEFYVTSLIEARSFANTEIHLSELRPIDRVAWEVTDRACRGCGKQSSLERRARKHPRRVPGDGHHARIKEEHSVRRLEDAYGVLKVREGTPSELRPNILGELIERGAA